jgi:DNA-directed RNA polymerase subunit M/transcription elongation factor TFIIS
MGDSMMTVEQARKSRELFCEKFKRSAMSRVQVTPEDLEAYEVRTVEEKIAEIDADKRAKIEKLRTMIEHCEANIISYEEQIRILEHE